MILKEKLLIFLLFLTSVLNAQFKDAIHAYYNGNYKESIKKVEDLLDKDSSNFSYEMVSEASLILGNNYLKLNKPYKALEQYTRGLYFINYRNDSHIKDELLFASGKLYHTFRLHKKSIEFFKRAKEQNKKVDYLVAENYLDLQQLDSALFYYTKAFKSANNNLKKKIILREIEIYLRKSDRVNAEKYLSKSKLFEQSKDVNLLSFYNQMGYLMSLKYDYQKAIHYYTKALEVSRIIGNKKEEALGLDRLALMYYKTNDIEKAKRTFRKAINIQKNAKYNTAVANDYNFLAKIYLQDLQPKKAQKVADSALLFINTTQASISLLNNHKIQGKIAEARKKFQKAKVLEQKSKRTERQLEAQWKIKRKERKLLERRIESIEDQFKETFRFKHFQDLAFDNLRLSNLNQQKELHLAYNEKQLKEKKLSLMKSKLAASKQAHRIDLLEKERSLNKLSLQKKELEAQQRANQIKSLEQENHVKQLELDLKSEKIKKQKYSNRILGLVGLLLVLTSIFFIYRFKQLKKHKALLATKEQLETESRLFRAQMNPHFMFNSLNSIKNFILENNTENADQYLTKYAKLMRNILNNSETAYVPLSTEMETLKLYLDLERLRFDNSFDYEIEIGDFIEEENTYVPPMLFQPHVENAILHAFKGIDYTGKIKIHIEEGEQLLHCTIADNGVGRNNPKKSIQFGEKEHDSKATYLIKKHLDFLSQQEGVKIEMEVIDLEDSSNKPIGTKVQLTLPYKFSTGA